MDYKMYINQNLKDKDYKIPFYNFMMEEIEPELYQQETVDISTRLDSMIVESTRQTGKTITLINILLRRVLIDGENILLISNSYINEVKLLDVISSILIKLGYDIIISATSTIYIEYIDKKIIILHDDINYYSDIDCVMLDNYSNIKNPRVERSLEIYRENNTSIILFTNYVSDIHGNKIKNLLNMDIVSWYGINTIEYRNYSSSIKSIMG